MQIYSMNNFEYRNVLVGNFSGQCIYCAFTYVINVVPFCYLTGTFVFLNQVMNLNIAF